MWVILFWEGSGITPETDNDIVEVIGPFATQEAALAHAHGCDEPWTVHQVEPPVRRDN